jgi:rod shape-determining protein MreC
MFKFFKNYRFRISIALLLIYFLLTLIIQVEKPRTDNWFSAFNQSVAYPFQTTYHFISNHIQEGWLHYLWLINVREQNRMLQKLLYQSRAENAENREIKIAYKRLLDTLDFKKKNSDIKVFAEVIGEVRNGFSRLIIINKGNANGIKKNFAVVSHEGIIGKIQSVTSFQSVVQLITDSHSKIPILIQRTRTKAFLQGSDGELKIIDILRRIEIKKHDKIITSGLAGIFPKGFPVGEITKIHEKSFGLFQKADVRPSVDFSKIEEVAVILKSVNNIHQPIFTESK